VVLKKDVIFDPATSLSLSQDTIKTITVRSSHPIAGLVSSCKRRD
jgi:hypothetical protein